MALESDQINSIISSEITPTQNHQKPLVNIRIICRFYYGEIPYWNNFIKYHKSLGAKDFLVFWKEDKRWIEENTKTRDINIQIVHDIKTSDSHHDAVAKNANPKLFRNDHNNKFQLLIDIDEYFAQHRSDITPEKSLKCILLAYIKYFFHQFYR